MSKEEYAEEMKKYIFHYLKGRKEERERILKLIDEKIKNYNSKSVIGMSIESYSNLQGRIAELEEIKEELEK